MPLAVGFLDAVSAGSDLVGAFIGSGFAATTFEDPALVIELLRRLGPGAELLEPVEWRADLRNDLSEMLSV